MKRAAAVVACALACATWPAVASGAPVGLRAAATAPPAAIDPDRAREQARDVLAQRRFQSNELPSPLRSVRERIGEALRKLGRPFEAVYGWVTGWFPGGPPVLITLLAGAILVGTAALVTRSVARRRQAADGAGALALGADAARCRAPRACAGRPTTPSGAATSMAPCACASAPGSSICTRAS